MLNLIATYFRLGALNELQYRTNFWVNLLQSLLAVGASVASMAIIFQHTEVLAGWTPPELLALLGIYFLMSGFIRTLVQPGLERFLQDVRQGTLDFVLTKPQDPQLLVSVRRMSLWSALDAVTGIVLIVIAVNAMHEHVGVLQLAAFAFLFLAGAVIVYGFWLMLATCAFWFVRVENILVIFQSMYAAGRWPVTIYPGLLRVLLTFVVPVAFAVTVPAEALVGRLNWTSVVIALVLAAAISALARAFWQLGIRHYSGASA